MAELKKYAILTVDTEDSEAMGLGLYIYDNGFGPRNYVCSNCNSIKLVRHHRGGFQPCYYVCDDCGQEVHAPKWINL